MCFKNAKRLYHGDTKSTEKTLKKLRVLGVSVVGFLMSFEICLLPFSWFWQRYLPVAAA
jgi:hypothetical protein